MDFLSISISIIALIISLFALLKSFSLRRSSIFTELTQQANIINEAISRNNIRGPYAYLLNKESKKDNRKLEALGTVFFHHINLLHMMYRNRWYLSRKVVAAYKVWIKTIFRPWLESEDELIKIWDLTRISRDLLGKDFIKWLETQLHKEDSNMEKSFEKHKNCQRKVLHEPVAPYFASIYNTLISVTQGVSLGSLFIILHEKLLNWNIICKVIVIFLVIAVIRHRYVVHNQYIAWRFGIFDTIIPMGFAILQLWTITIIPKNIYIFSFSFTMLSTLGICAYLNTYFRFKNPKVEKLYKEHFDTESHHFVKDLLLEIKKFEIYAIYTMIIVATVSCLLTFSNYYIDNLSEEIKTVSTSLIYIVICICLLYYDLRRKLKKSNSTNLKKYAW